LDSEFLSNLDDLTQPSPQIARDDQDDDETGTVDPDELHDNSSLWNSLWSQGRGILNTNRHVDAEEDDDGNLSEAEGEETSAESQQQGDGNQDEKSEEKATGQTAQERTRRKSEIISLSRARKIKVTSFSPSL
jgi:hypothetical protein